MTENTMTFAEVLHKGDEPPEDLLRNTVQLFVRELMEAEVKAQVGADRFERSADRVTQRNGYRRRPWDPRVGTLELQIPKLRTGSYFPSWLEPRRR